MLYNDAYAPMLGERHPSALGVPFREAWPDIWDEIAPLVTRVFAGRTMTFQDARMIMKRYGYEEETWWNFSYSPVRDETGAVAGLLNVTVDASARKRAERAEAVAHATDERLARVLDGMGEGFGLLAPDFTILEHNREALRLDGRKREQIVGRSLWDTFPGVETSEVGALLRHAMSTRQSVSVEHYYTWEEGHALWLEMRAYPTTDGTLALFWSDATARRQAQDALRMSEERQTFLLKLSDTFRLDADETSVGRTCVEALSRQMDVDRCYITEMFEDENIGIVGPEFYAPGLHPISGKHSFDNYPDAMRRVRSGMSLISVDVANDPELSELDKASLGKGVQVQAIASAFLYRGDGRPIWALTVGSATPRAWTRDEIQLVQEVGERAWAAIERARDAAEQKAANDRQQLLLAELQHRVRNILANIRSIAHRTAESSHTVEDMSMHLNGRISALARTQAMLSRNPGAGVDLEDILRDELLGQVGVEDQITIEGDGVELSPKAAEVVTLALHELATNAVKYGALRDGTGKVAVVWRKLDREGETWLRLAWVESGVRVVATAPRRDGFGTELITRRVPYELAGSGTIDLRPGGISATIEIPLRVGHSILEQGSRI